ncbi:MAG: hypothetical protein PVI99_08745 [Anaerolineales bacterium]|jgi:hypothetical protein
MTGLTPGGIGSGLEEFASRLLRGLAFHLAPAEVSCLGSLASSTHDDLSDVDLRAQVHVPLDNAFFASLEQYLSDQYGPALIRYDPEDRTTTQTQNMHISFYNRPVFWKVDLAVESSVPAGKKFHDPFPDWNPAISALMNLVWAVKYYRRGEIDSANHYLSCACQKLSLTPFPYEEQRLRELLEVIRTRPEIDPLFVRKFIREFSD